MVKIAREAFEVFVDNNGFWRRPPTNDELKRGESNGKWLRVEKGEQIPLGVLPQLELHMKNWVEEGEPVEISIEKQDKNKPELKPGESVGTTKPKKKKGAK